MTPEGKATTPAHGNVLKEMTDPACAHLLFCGSLGAANLEGKPTRLAHGKVLKELTDPVCAHLLSNGLLEAASLFSYSFSSVDCGRNQRGNLGMVFAEFM